MADSMNKIECPNCGASIDVEHVLTQKIENETRERYDSLYKEKINTLLQKEKELTLLEKNQEERIAGELQKREQALQDKLAAEYKGDYEKKMSRLSLELEKKDKELLELKSTEIELEKARLELKNRDREYELNLEREKLRLGRQIEDEVGKREAEKYDMRIREKDKKLQDLEKQIDELKRKSEQGSVQLQGEVQELAIEDMLGAIFPSDEVVPVPKGKAGADTILLVRAGEDQPAGKILYESKRTKNFSPGWIDKLKTDQRRENADIAVLVTEAMPSDIEHIGNMDGVWVCSFSFLRPLSLLLRESIIKVDGARRMQKNAGDKMSLLYEYLTGNEFKLQIESILEGFLNLKQSIDKEKLAMEKMWKEREKQLEKVLLSTTRFYGSIKGIAGSGVPEIGLLEFEEK
jgi:hypothetical protein